MADASISDAAWLNAPATRRVMAALAAARPGGARFVGGCVRNALIGAPVDDIDIATQLLPEETIAAAEAAGIAAIPTGIAHGTLTLVADHTPFEVTSLRRDVETDGRRAVVAFTQDWAEDAQRRDFRMNALYADATGTIHDPTGGGIEDARAGRVIFVGDPETRIREDYLRILRFFRFLAWYGKDADAAGLAACAKLKDGLAGLSVERVWKEARKLLAARDPRVALAAMEASGVRAAALPEWTRVARLEALLKLENELLLEGHALTRLAAALEDQAAARALAQRLKLSNEERGRIVAALGGEERIVSYLSPREVRRALYKLGNEAFGDRVMLAWAGEGHAKNASAWRALIAMAQSWARPKLPLTGEDVIAAGAPPGPKVGQVMREVEAWWIDADFPDDKLAVIERLKAVARALS